MTTWANDYWPPPRPDILQEITDATNSSGDYASPWTESTGVGSVRVACLINGGSDPVVTLQEGMYSESDSSGPRTIRDQPVPPQTSGLAGYVRSAELALTARYFRIVVANGGASSTVFLNVRSV